MEEPIYLDHNATTPVDTGAAPARFSAALKSAVELERDEETVLYVGW